MLILKKPYTTTQLTVEKRTRLDDLNANIFMRILELLESYVPSGVDIQTRQAES